MLFKDTKQGYPVYLLDKEQVRATQGKVVSVSQPRVQAPQVGVYPQNPLTTSLVVDVTIEADGQTKTYTIPETSSLTYAGQLALSIDKECILREVQALKTASEEALGKMDTTRRPLSTAIRCSMNVTRHLPRSADKMSASPALRLLFRTSASN